MTPEQVAAEVDAVSLLGRGGAGFPAGRKWSMLRKASTTYLVVNGDESEPATFKDHLLVERDPHQLVEGVVIAAYAIQATRAFIYVRGEFALGLERVQGGGQRRLRPRRRGQGHLRVGVLDRRRGPPRSGRLHLRRGDGAAREPRGQARLPAHQAPVLPGRHRPLRRAHRGEQRRDAVQPALGDGQRLRRLHRPGGGAVHGDAALRPGRPRAQPRRVRGRDGEDHLPRPRSIDPVLGGGIPDGRQLKAHHPRRGVGPVVRSRAPRPAPWARTRWATAGSMLGSGSIVVMDDTTCVVRAAWRITRFFWRESCGQCTPCREGSGWLEKILRAHRGRRRARVGPGPAHGRVRQPGPRGVVAAAADDDLRAGLVHPVVDRVGHPHVP